MQLFEHWKPQCEIRGSPFFVIVNTELTRSLSYAPTFNTSFFKFSFTENYCETKIDIKTSFSGIWYVSYPRLFIFPSSYLLPKVVNFGTEVTSDPWMILKVGGLIFRAIYDVVSEKNRSENCFNLNALLLSNSLTWLYGFRALQIFSFFQ